MLDPAGPAARSISGLWWIMLAGGVAIFVLVMLLIAAAFRPKRSETESPDRERLWIYGLGLGFSLTVLAALTMLGLATGERLLPVVADDVVKVRAEGRQWAWRFGYDDAPARSTDNVLHIPAGRPVDVAITSVDVIHSFWVPRLAGKLDAIPGHTNVLRLQADQPGRYAGRSAEFSGDNYLLHRFEVVAHGADSWQAFLAGAAP